MITKLQTSVTIAKLSEPEMAEGTEELEECPTYLPQPALLLMMAVRLQSSSEKSTSAIASSSPQRICMTEEVPDVFGQYSPLEYFTVTPLFGSTPSSSVDNNNNNNNKKYISHKIHRIFDKEEDKPMREIV